MRAANSLRLLPLLAPLLLLACQKPPADAFVQGAQTASKPAAQISIGKNSVGEDCTQSAATGDRRVLRYLAAA